MNNNKKKIPIIVVSVILIAVAFVGAMFIIENTKKSKTAETIMVCSVNPEVQFVLNKKDEVISVKAINDDGDALIFNSDFVGLKADEAAKLFVKLSSEAGYVDVDSTEGTKVTITLIGNKENYDSMKSEIVSTVNKYFDENGIIAGAVAEVKEDVKEVLKDVYADIENLDNKTKEELVKLYAEHLEKTKDIAHKYQEELSSSYDSLKAVYKEATEISTIAYAGLKAAFEAFEVLVESNSVELSIKLKPLFNVVKAQNYDELQAALTEAEKALEEVEIPENLKEGFNNVISSAKNLLSSMKESHLEAKKEFEDGYNAAIQDAVEKSKQYYESIKTEMNSKITEAKQKLQDRKTYYEENKEAVDQAIEDFRASLVVSE